MKKGLIEKTPFFLALVCLLSCSQTENFTSKDATEAEEVMERYLNYKNSSGESSFYQDVVTYTRVQSGIRSGKSFDATYTIKVSRGTYAYFEREYVGENSAGQSGRGKSREFYYVSGGSYWYTQFEQFALDGSTTSTTEVRHNSEYESDEDSTAQEKFAAAIETVYAMVTERADSCFNYLETVIDYGESQRESDISFEGSDGNLTAIANKVDSYLDNVSILCDYEIRFESYLPTYLESTIVNSDEDMDYGNSKYISTSVVSSFEWGVCEETHPDDRQNSEESSSQGSEETTSDDQSSNSDNGGESSSV